ncbi:MULTISPECIES: GNAT family N-acetyltransferase [Ochrobactrum]|uniref:Acetyltransferase family protein n=1 Tax=Ochrobactrum quorumnocens TaxID=271865 RepID=A0A248UFG4_9HYPH|nr:MULTISPECIES: GNAT family N-acetyltransferase [Brucella/Ochrobactrum group]MBD7992260.1 GNAT family N-acetyltransferase [Ochrobactrum gallinarum]ASV85362.1 acetyltransferase family protein [[Ochrobactrum] quorumnocens]KAA9366835.1 GNAT family N-acetyltransferase [[Ochrobactrum] quorumnocens]MCV9906417.1 GNAT family N-acetyltransferase [Brucella sp. HL-2]MDH7789990.1 ElaA protein [Ochrobactrum sp. AN78]
MSEKIFVSQWGELDNLTPRALYAMLKLRVDVFVVEQKCPYPEIDGKDYDAFHLRILDNEELAASLRVLPPESTGKPVKIGRVVVAADYRGYKLGQRLMKEAVEFAHERFPGIAIELGGQSHLQKFYGSFGFVAISEEYLEDGIPHVDMRLDPKEVTA